MTFRFDTLTLVMMGLVLAIASVILVYSRRYLDGEPRRPAYLAWFGLTVGGVMLLVTTNNLLVLALAWVGVSLALHQLLTFFRDRPQAIIAAHKKFLLSRVADVAILSAVGLIGRTFGTLEIDRIAAHARALPEIPAALELGGLLLAGGVLLRSAQLPFHGWLIQVMEAPTPVSALLHAGIVNIGGFVMIRLGGMMVRLEAAQTLLVVAGLVTAALAALVMMTRVSVKVALAWSTAAQMGFMLVECGLGAYGLALLHLVAHSLYKAHAFLSSGRAVEQQILRSMSPRVPAASVGRWIAGAIAGLAVVAAAGATLHLSPSTEPSLAALGLVLGLALAPLFVRASQEGGVQPMLTALGAAVAIVAIYAGWHLLLGAMVPPIASGTAGETVRLGLVVVGFLLLFGVQALLSAAPDSRLTLRLYPACFAGFYLDEIFTRLTFRVWPPRPAPALAALERQRATLAMERAA